MLDLSALVFKVDTSELDGALTKVGALETSVGKLAEASKVFSKASKDASTATKEMGDAADQAAKKSSEAAKKQADGQDQVNEAVKKTNSVLERQTQITEFMAQGFSRGQSSILTTAKAAGALTEELVELSKTLETQRTLMGTDAFDKSMGAMKLLANEYKILTDVNQMYNQNLGISVKQMADLAREKLRLIEASKAEGKTAEQTEISIKKLTEAFVAQATAQNALTSRIKADQQAVKDTANANEYLEKELGRVTYALGQMNEGLNRSSSNALLKFEQALKASGKPLEEQIILMERYKKSLADLQQKQAKTNTDYISRAVAPQLTDIFVGLSTGQSPLTVLLQQGGQLRDQFSMAGIEADKMAATMKTALASMLPSIMGVGKALMEMVVGGLTAAGTAVVEFLAKWTGISKVNDGIKWIGDKLLSKENAAALSSNIDKVSGALTGVLGVAIAGSIIALGAMGVELANIIKTEAELSKALATSGGDLNMTKTQAMEMAAGMRGASGSVLDIAKAFAEAAKAGNIGSDSLEMVTRSALDMERYAGQSIAETMKQFAAMEDKPVKALGEIAEKTGLVDAKTYALVVSLSEQGKKAEATKVAMDALAKANADSVAEIKANMSPLEKLWDNMKLALIAVKNAMYDVVTSDKAVGTFNLLWVIVAGTISTVWSGLKIVGATLNGIFATINAAAHGDFGIIGNIWKEVNSDIKDVQVSQTAYIKSLLSSTEETVKFGAVDKSVNSQAAKDIQATHNLREEVMRKRSKMEQEIGEQMVRNANLEKLGVQTAAESQVLIDAIRKKYTEKTSVKEASSTYREIADNEISITEAMYARKVQLLKQNLSFESQALKSAFESGQMTRGQYVIAELNLINKAESDITSVQSEALDVRAQLYRKAVDNEISQYLRAKKETEGRKDAEKANENLDRLLQERLANLTRSYEGYAEKISDANTALANSATLREAKAMAELLAPTRELIKINKEYSEAEQKHNLMLQNKIALQAIEANSFPVDIAAYKARTEELNRYTVYIAKYMEDLKAARQVLDELNNSDDALTPEGIERRKKAYDQWLKVKAELDKVYLDQQDSAERAAMQARLKFWNDYAKELSKGISDSIVTALFEGGKAGSQKLRDLIIAKLKEPITLIINAIINPIVSSIVGSITSALGLGGSGGGIGGIVGAGANMLGLGGMGAGLGALGSGLASGASEAMLGAGFVGPSATAASGIMGIGATIGTYLPHIAATLIAIKLLSSLDGGETRSGGQYAIAYDGKVTNNRRGESYEYDTQKYNVDDRTGNKVTNGNAYLIEAGGMGEGEKLTKDLVKATADNINSILKDLGSTAQLNGFWTGFENSGEGRGGVFTGGSLTNGRKFGESGKGNNYAGTLYEKTSTNSPDMKQVIANWQTDLKQATIEALQQVDDIPKTIKDMVKDIDAEKLTDEEVSALIKQITDVIAGVKTLDQISAALHMDQLKSLSFDAAAGLIKLAGGIDTLKTELASYYDNFYTADEKNAITASNIKTSLATVGIKDVPKTREEWRKLMEAQDLNTEAGRKAYEMLLKLSGAFAGITKSSDDAAAAAKAEAQAKKDAAKAAAESAMQNAFDALKASVDAQKAIINAQIQTLNTTLSTLTSLFNAIKSNVDDLYNSVASTASMNVTKAASLIDEVLSSGSIPNDTTGITDAMGVLKSSVTSGTYASKFDEDRARLLLANKLSDLQKLTGDQVSITQQQLDAANSQIKILDKILEDADKQIKEAQGINTSILSVADAVNNLNMTVQAFIEAQAASNSNKPGVTQTTQKPGEFTIGGGGSSKSPTPKESGYGGETGSKAGKYWGYTNLGTYGYAGHVVTDQAAIDRYTSIWTYTQQAFGDGSKGNLETIAATAKQYGVSQVDLATATGFDPEQIKAMFDAQGIPAFAGGGTSAPGLFVAGEHGKEIVATGSARIWNAGQTASMLNDSSSNDAMVAELQALREEVVNLRAETRAVVTNTSTTAKVLDRARGTGDALRTTTA